LGLQLIGDWTDEGLLLDIARDFERKRGLVAHVGPAF
jgi:Asp-tRNA(Asn)/Glu-tRNA(Gln) amidotransferase A subunit family amidase